MPRLRALLSLRAAALLAGATAVLLAPAGSAADPVSQLRSERAGLTARQHQVLLDLYALDSRLGRVQEQLASLRTESAQLQHERVVVRAQLRAARRTLARAQSTLAQELRALYEQAEPDPLAVILGATSLAAAVDGIDTLRRSAAATQAVIGQAGTARRDVGALARTLADREQRVRSLERAKAAQAVSLAQARAERSAYLDRLQAEQQLKAEQIATLETRAQAAEAQAKRATIQATAASSVASFTAQPPPVAPPATTAPGTAAPTASSGAVDPPASSGRALVVVSTGYALPGTTATGLPVGNGIVAVDPTVIPLGTQMTIPGYGEGVAADTGGAITGNRIDLWFPSVKQALDWGWRTLTITLH